jgi:hypothetical protein
MNKKNLVILALLLGMVLLINSCATKPVTQLYPEKWEKTYIGMSLEEFKQIWTEAKGPFQDINKNIIYTVSPPYTPFSTGVKIVYFTFENNKLTKFNET